MKRLIVLAMALGLMGATALANGFGAYNPSVYEKEDSDSALYQQKQQMLLYYQNAMLQNQASLQSIYAQRVINDLSAGKDTEATRAFIAQYNSQQAQPQQPQSLVPMYQQQYENSMAANQSKYMLENGSKLMAPYYEQLARAQGQEMVAGAQYQSQMNNMQRKAQMDDAKCHSGSRSPVDSFMCSDSDYNDYMYSTGRVRYEREKQLRKWLSI